MMDKRALRVTRQQREVRTSDDTMMVVTIGVGAVPLGDGIEGSELRGGALTMVVVGQAGEQDGSMSRHRGTGIWSPDRLEKALD